MSQEDLILYRLQQLETRFDKTDAKVDGLDVKLDIMTNEVAGWKGKASAWGVIGGALMAVLTTIAARVLAPK